MSLESDIAALLEIVPEDAQARVDEYRKEYERNLNSLHSLEGDDSDLEPIHLYFLEAIRDVLADYPHSRRMIAHSE